MDELLSDCVKFTGSEVQGIVLAYEALSGLVHAVESLVGEWDAIAQERWEGCFLYKSVNYTIFWFTASWLGHR